mgnify:CR=1 FL=1
MSNNVRNKKRKDPMVGLIIVAVLMAALSVMADKVRSREEADAKLSCRVLGALYHESKHKMLKSWFSKKKESILITHPLTSFMYSESVHKLASRIDRHRHKGEHVIMVTLMLMRRMPEYTEIVGRFYDSMDAEENYTMG